VVEDFLDIGGPLKALTAAATAPLGKLFTWQIICGSFLAPTT